jgi:hypothetical protein
MQQGPRSRDTVILFSNASGTGICFNLGLNSSSGASFDARIITGNGGRSSIDLLSDCAYTHQRFVLTELMDNASSVIDLLHQKVDSFLCQ